MAVEDTTNTDAADTSAAADTSTNEETTDTDDDVDLNAENPFDDIEIDESDETEESEGDDDAEDSATTDEETDASEESEEDEDDAEAEEADDKSEKEETTKPDPKEQARLAYQERQREKAAEAARAEAKKAAQDKYLEGAEDEKDLALRQVQIATYNNLIDTNTTKLETSLERAVASIDLFRTGTPAVKQKLIRAVEQFDAIYVKKDKNGDPVKVTGDLVEYLTEEADSIRNILGDGATQQTSAKSKQKSRTLTPPVKAPKKPKKDPGLEGFDEEAAK